MKFIKKILQIRNKVEKCLQTMQAVAYIAASYGHLLMVTNCVSLIFG